MSRCAYDPPCPNRVLDVMVPLNPRMPTRNACAAHALPQVMPLGLASAPVDTGDGRGSDPAAVLD